MLEKPGDGPIGWTGRLPDGHTGHGTTRANRLIVTPRHSARQRNPFSERDSGTSDALLEGVLWVAGQVVAWL